MNSCSFRASQHAFVAEAQYKERVMAPSMAHTRDLNAVETTAVRDLLGRMGIDAPVEAVVAELARAGVDVTEQQVETIRASLAAGASQSPRPAQQARPAQEQASPEWHEQEQTAEPANVQAQRLLEETGSPELAKQAVDTVAARSQPGHAGTPSHITPPHTEKTNARAPERMANPGSELKDRFAQELGYQSYLELFEGSTPVPTHDGKAWCVSNDNEGNWIAWNDQDLSIHRRGSSKEEAIAAVPRRGAG
jgi:hypothetical protein